MGFDGHYAMPAAVTLRSLGGSLRSGETATIHVLAVEIDNEDRGRIERSLPPSLDIRWYEFDVDHISGLPISSMSDEVYITRTAYTLLFLDRYLPSEIDRVLFLDADTLVRRSPAGLFGIDLGGCALGAVQDFGCPAIGLPKGVAGWRELGLDGRLPAFNTGFLLIDRGDPVGRLPGALRITNPLRRSGLSQRDQRRQLAPPAPDLELPGGAGVVLRW
jgi:lipopolysaccharide biosynthesis glycosyltransferase